ncbi:MAG: phosphoribosylamine--glycine ligase [Burkholderiales bacterium]|nr:phosphoribosylamine--glycine ligase [Burkholderiales bacterium]
MQKHGVKTAKYQNFYNYDDAVKYLDEVNYPVVVKASGLAAGKGVIIAQSYEEANTALKEMFIDKVFGDSGLEVVIEEFLVGVEASILSFTDSKVIVPFISAKDHKKIGDGETGLNTGGMGVIAPNPYVTPEVNQAFISDIMEPTLRGLQAENMDFAGVIFFGVMITDNGVYLLEYNMRMGDPETEAVLPLMKSDLLEIVNLAIDRKLSEARIEWNSGATCCVVLASGGYPEKFPTGIVINGIKDFHSDSCELFAAGVAKVGDDFVTSGGRVINIVGHGSNLDEARKIAYQELNKIQFAGAYCRQDIGIVN